MSAADHPHAAVLGGDDVAPARLAGEVQPAAEPLRLLGELARAAGAHADLHPARQFDGPLANHDPAGGAALAHEAYHVAVGVAII